MTTPHNPDDTPIVPSDAGAATPRTDDRVHFHEGPDLVSADFARTLERELSAEKARRGEAERLCAIYRNDWTIGNELNSQLRASLATSEHRSNEQLKALDAYEEQVVSLESVRDSLHQRLATSEALRVDAEKRDENTARILRKVMSERAEAHRQTQLACREREAEKVMRSDAEKKRDDAVAQRAQAEAKVRDLEQSLAAITEKAVTPRRSNPTHAQIDLDTDRMCPVCLLRQINESKSALTTERHAREQAESDCAQMRTALTICQWKQEQVSFENYKYTCTSCGYDKSRNEHHRNCVSNNALSTNSGKPLLARLEKAEADASRMRDVLHSLKPLAVEHAKLRAHRGNQDTPCSCLVCKAVVAMSATTEEGR